MDEAERAFWSVAVQLSALLGLGVVLETRYSAERFKNSARGYRALESGLLLAAGIAIGLVGVAAVFLLATDWSNSGFLAIAPYALSFGLVVLVINPVLFLIGGLNGDIIYFGKAFMPWSLYRKSVRGVKKGTRKYQENMSLVEAARSELDQLDAVEESFVGPWREANKTAKMIVKDPSQYSAEEREWAMEIRTKFAPIKQKSREKARSAKKGRRDIEEYAERLAESGAWFANAPAVIREVLLREADEAREKAIAVRELGRKVALEQSRRNGEQSSPDNDSREGPKAPPHTPKIS